MRSVQGSTGFPFLEATNLWESVHSSLIVYLAAALNRVLPPVYVAVVEEWLHVPPPRQGIRPDIVIGNAPTYPSGNVAILERSPLIADTPILVGNLEDNFHQHFINIVRAGDTSDVITTLECLSHLNKAPSRNRDAYLRKQRAICDSLTHFVEIDLLRAGSPTLAVSLERPETTPYDYLICLYRGGTGAHYALWPTTLQQPLPKIAIPLEGDVPDVVVDLQTVLERTYTEGAFSRLIDYDLAPIPLLSGEDNLWLEALLISQELR